MQSKTIFDYIYLGTALRYLQDAEPAFLVAEDGHVCDNIDYFLTSLTELNLHVTSRAAYELRTFREDLDSYLAETEKTGKKRESIALGSEKAKALSKIMTRLRYTFDAETMGIHAYITSEKRYEVDKLSNRISSLFGQGTFTKLPKLAQHDFQEAGKCIVFERPTAAAFHMLRATEGVLKLYFKKYLRGGNVERTWGQLLVDLKGKSHGRKPNQTTLNHLQNIKDSFRNPTNHPDKVYSVDESQDLLSLCLDVVNRMMTEID